MILLSLLLLSLLLLLLLLFAFGLYYCINRVGLKCVRRETLLQSHCCRHETQRTVQQLPLSVPLPLQTAL